MARKYWLTVHWPQPIDSDSEIDLDVYLLAKYQTIGTRLKVGDYVWIYETKGGPSTILKSSKKKIRRQIGRRSVVALTKVRNPLHQIKEFRKETKDQSKRWWRWKAELTNTTLSGFFSYKKLNRLLHYKPTYTLYGFGEEHSGLKEISEETHEKILKAFKKSHLQQCRSLRVYQHAV